MTNGGSLQPRPTKNQKREAAREKSRQLREEQAKRDKRKRLAWQIGGIVGVIVIAVAVFFGYQAWHQDQVSASGGPANMISDGLVVNAQGPVLTGGIPAGGSPTPTVQDNSSGAVNITVYYDYLCPYCGEFETANGTYIQQLVQNGATLEMHPIAILTTGSAGTRYSERAANAFACVANYEPDVALAFNALLFANQPAEGSTGLSDSQLKDYVAQAGATDTDAINTCIDKQTFRSWVQAATSRAQAGPIPNSSLSKLSGTPTVLVNGQQYVTNDLTDQAAFKAFVTQAVSESASTATATPAP